MTIERAFISPLLYSKAFLAQRPQEAAIEMQLGAANVAVLCQKGPYPSKRPLKTGSVTVAGLYFGQIRWLSVFRLVIKHKIPCQRKWHTKSGKAVVLAILLSYSSPPSELSCYWP